MLIFAYGSNMDPVQMRQRCPGAETVGSGVLRDHRLVLPAHVGFSRLRRVVR